MPLSKSKYLPQPTEPALNGNGSLSKSVDDDKYPLPISAENLAHLLVRKLSSNYKEKFGTKHVVARNVFSVSALVSGPGSAVGQRMRILEGTDDQTGEEALVFNYPMFRGSAIHKYVEWKMPDWYAYEKFPVREEFDFEWKDNSAKSIIINGHPDFVHHGKLECDGVVFCDDMNASVVLELKTISSNLEDKKELQRYKEQVVKKAKKQVGWYAKVLSREIKRHYFGYVVTFDDSPEKLQLTEEDRTVGFKMINDGTYKLILDEKMRKKGYVFDSHIRVHPLTENEAWHGYNYIKWSAREAANMLVDREKKLAEEAAKATQSISSDIETK